MSRSLLQGVNEVLKKAKLIQGDSGSLTSLTDSPRQLWVDTVVQSWNEVIDELYSTTDTPKPQQLSSNTITLATNDRSYALQSDLITIYFPLIDETNGQYIYEYSGGYLALINSQPVPADYTGLPIYGIIDPTNGELYLDRIPTATENGLVYKYRYNKDFSLDAAADTFPFTDAVFRALVPAVTEIFNYYHKKEFSETVFNLSMGRAARLVTGIPMRKGYLPSRTRDAGIMNPFD